MNFKVKIKLLIKVNFQSVSIETQGERTSRQEERISKKGEHIKTKGKNNEAGERNIKTRGKLLKKENFISKIKLKIENSDPAQFKFPHLKLSDVQTIR